MEILYMWTFIRNRVLCLLNVSLSVTYQSKYFKSNNLRIEEPSFSNELGGDIKLHSCWKTLQNINFFFSFFLGK